jgi:hypothetical protein
MAQGNGQSRPLDAEIRGFSASKRAFEILPTVKDAFNEHRIVQNHESDSDAALKSDGPEASQDVVTRCAANRKGLEPFAECNDTIDVGCSAVIAGSHGDVVVQALNLTFGQWRKNDGT